PMPGREREMLDWATRWFDAIFVHGDERFARFEDTFPFADELGPVVRYTGFVMEGDRVTPEPAADRDEVIVSAGGGGVGSELLATALAAQARTRLAHLTWRVLAGPNITDAALARLHRAAGPRAIVERARVDFRA